MRRRVASWLAAGLLTLAPGRAVAQGVAVDVVAFNMQRRVFYQSEVYEQTGMTFGAEGAVRMGPMRLRVRGRFGTLKGDGSGLNPDVKLRTTAVTVEVAVQPWIALGAVGEARRYEAGAGISTWKVLGVMTRLEPPLGLSGLRGLAEGALLPAGSASNGPKAKVAFQFLVGVTYQLPHSPFQARLGYRFERYDFEASSLSPERYEQFQGVIAEAGLRFGRW